VADELIVSVGGGTRVAVDELFAEAAALGALHRACREWAQRSRELREWVGSAGIDVAPGAGGDTPGYSLHHAWVLFDRAAVEAEGLHASLVGCAERYGHVEQVVTAMWDLGARYGASVLGLTFPLWAAPAGLVGATLAGAAAVGLWSPERTIGALGSNPAVIRLVRSAGGAIDEAVLGRIGVPPALAVLLGRSMRASENASVMLGAAATFGLVGSTVLVDGPVTVRRASTSTARVPAPNGIAQLAARVPRPGAGGPQVRVERYGSPASPRWIVYIAGTVSGSASAGRQPWDLTSDLHAVAAGSALEPVRPGARSGGAEEAVREALAAAGATAGDPVLSVGHSLGGITAAQLAGGATYNVVGAVNLGGPVASVDTGEVPVLSLEHEEDVIPALAGPPGSSPGLVTVRRSVLAGTEASGPLPAHGLEHYRATASLVDRSDAPALAAFGALVRDLTGGAQGERTEWIAARSGRDPVSSGSGAR